MAAPPTLGRTRILAVRRRLSHLDRRLGLSADSLRRAAWGGLTDSTPRAAVLSIHARVAGVDVDILDHDALVQIWGPRFSTYVVAVEDRAVFTLGRLPLGGAGLERAFAIADRLDELLGGDEVGYAEAGRALGFSDGNALRYAATTGRVLIGWQGSGKPTVRMVPRPDVEPWTARMELARRYLHVFGPSNAASFARWAGIRPAPASAVIERIEPELIEVDTPVGRGWILADDQEEFTEPADPSTDGGRADGDRPRVRMLPSGDTYSLLQGVDRELLVPRADQRARLWTPRVWPGAVLVDGSVVGTWRRSANTVTVESWRRLPAGVRRAVEAEIELLPLPERKPMITKWD